MSIVDLKLPKYNVVLPISSVKVEFRPFTVKEEKILLLAQEEDNSDSIINSIAQIISNCTFGKHTIDTLNKVDAEFLYVQLRNKSMGEGVDIRAICKECKHKTPMTINFDNVTVSNLDKKVDTIKLVDNIWVTLKYPTLKESLSVKESDDITAIAYILDTIIEGENVKNASDYTLEERKEFVESLTSKQIIEFKGFLENFPVLSLDIDYACKCGVDNHIHIEGLENFFG